MRILIILCILLVFVGVGCGHKSEDPRINVRSGVGSDTPGSNVITRPIANAFSALIGEGIEINKAVMNRNDKSDLIEIFVSGYNRSPGTKRFRYRVEWLDANGLVIDTKTSVWLPMSAMGKSTFQIKAVSPRSEAVNFRMDTRKWE